MRNNSSQCLEKAASLGTQPLGTSHPPGDPHAVSFSLPTWASVAGNMAGEGWVRKKKQTTYPRMGFCPIVRRLTEAALGRVKRSARVNARIFISKEAASRLERTVKEKDPTVSTSIIEFKVRQTNSQDISNWARFVMVLFPESVEGEAFTFWLNHGDGISNRHAEFCLNLLDFMDSRSDDAEPDFQTCGPRSEDMPADLPAWTNSGLEEKTVIKSVLAGAVRSQIAGNLPAQPEDVFLYSTGMMAIGKIARAMSDVSGDDAAVIFGWLYSGTLPLIKDSGYGKCLLYGRGTEEELDQLEASLAAGAKCNVLFSEITSNPQLHSPNLVRIRQLADKYGFTVVVDDTIGTSANLDIFPYADVITTSLTKIFNGACNAMGGSLIVNPKSYHYKEIHGYLQDHFEDLLFPADAVCDCPRDCPFSGSAPSVDYVNYPTLVSSRAEYERYRRDGEGYGYLLSVVFREPDFAVKFFDALNVWKGPSIGTNSSIALPYSVLAHWEEQEWAAEYGVPKHIVRLSVGLEPEAWLRARVAEALAQAGPVTLCRTTQCETGH
ncbi:hypothetical protein N7490_011330 [Penicillium lividum]|nr:hypothetical protein N7490_011330 [Penicillium lividum]